MSEFIIKKPWELGEACNGMYTSIIYTIPTTNLL